MMQPEWSTTIQYHFLLDGKLIQGWRGKDKDELDEFRVVNNTYLAFCLVYVYICHKQDTCIVYTLYIESDLFTNDTYCYHTLFLLGIPSSFHLPQLLLLHQHFYFTVVTCQLVSFISSFSLYILLLLIVLQTLYFLKLNWSSEFLILFVFCSKENQEKKIDKK